MVRLNIKRIPLRTLVADNNGQNYWCLLTLHDLGLRHCLLWNFIRWSVKTLSVWYRRLQDLIYDALVRLAHVHFSFTDFFLLSLYLVKDLVEFLSQYVFRNLPFETCVEWHIKWVVATNNIVRLHFLHNDVCDGIQDLRLSQRLSWMNRLGCACS